MVRRLALFSLVLLGMAFQTGCCHRHQVLRAHRHYHKKHIPYEVVGVESCSCSSGTFVPTAAPAVLAQPAANPTLIPSGSPVEIIPTPKAMPKTIGQ